MIFIDSETFSVADAEATRRSVNVDKLANLLNIGVLKVFILILMKELDLFAPVVSVESCARLWRVML